MLSKHYAPQTKTILSEAITQDLILFDKSSANLSNFEMKYSIHEVLSPTGNLTEAASIIQCFALDQLHLDVIIAERFPDYGLGRTINDRLERATTK
jgi:L-threonylcarbamoyladenylate synthase